MKDSVAIRLGVSIGAAIFHQPTSLSGQRDWSSKSLRPAEMDQRRRPSQQRGTTQLE
jgi:hypothetical protein